MSINPTQILKDREQFHVTSAGDLDTYFEAVFGIAASEVINEALWLVGAGFSDEAAGIIVEKHHDVTAAVVVQLVETARATAKATVKATTEE